MAGPWAAILDAFDDPSLQQVTIRGSVQSGKTAALIAAALYHASQGRAVLVYKPDDKLRRALGKRIIAWGRRCREARIALAYGPERPPMAREIEGGGRLEVLSASEHGATLSRTAETVIVDELRAFREDVLGGLIDRMAAYGGKGRLITASSAGYESECKTTAELEKSDNQRWLLHCLDCGRATVPAWESFRMPKGRAAPFYVMPCCGAALSTAGLRRAVAAGTLAGDTSAGRRRDARLSPRLLLEPVRDACLDRARLASGNRPPTGDDIERRDCRVSVLAPGASIQARIIGGRHAGRDRLELSRRLSGRPGAGGRGGPDRGR